ncbi:MAG: hypothetical protein JXJ20_08375 [Anaerolineae bacterium]|jgi:hypothetical protein|nr:hypothetical protein [Anaerolineae bacterium]
MKNCYLVLGVILIAYLLVAVMSMGEERDTRFPMPYGADSISDDTATAIFVLLIIVIFVLFILPAL